ncbi:restriction endonuclease [Candidatus Daviesbacteria bacterium]|nr:restriction endonuclease [Candidatus Daviesbacteria bacterium]
MRIAGLYSFAGGQQYVTTHHNDLLKEIEEAIMQIDAYKALTKESKEKTMIGKMLYSPVELNKAFGERLYPKYWKHVKENCEYPANFYVNGYKPKERKIYPFRDMDFVKNKLGIEVQFGKYSFMVYNVCAKMTIFKKLGHIDSGVEIVPVKELAEQMSTGVSYFEQFVWDLEKRGVSDIDVPVLIIGINV